MARQIVQTAKDAAITASLRPLFRSLLVPLAIYFVFVAGIHFSLQSGATRVVLVSLAIITAIASTIARRALIAPSSTLRTFEIYSSVVFGLIYANVLLHVLLDFDPKVLVYFQIMATLFALIAPTAAIAAAGILVPAASFFAFAASGDMQFMIDYSFIGVAGFAIAGGMCWMVRQVVKGEVQARLRADELAESVLQIADTDSLTNLANRRFFLSSLRDWTKQAESTQSPFFVGVIDLDGFKPINDLFGHSTGDLLLVEVGRRLKCMVDDRHFVGRLGGDEFAFIIKDVSDTSTAYAFCDRIASIVSERFEINGVHVGISCTIGLARYPDAGTESTELYEKADFALYAAKQSARGATRLFDTSLENEMNRNGQVEYLLRNSDLTEELFVVFQPQFDVIDQRTVGFEALGRWHSATLGMVPPDVFIRAAERAGRIEHITAILFKKALDAMAGWPEHLHMSFNLSVQDLISPASISTICWLMRESGVDPRRIEFEITETAVMTNFDLAKESLGVLVAQGSRIALDDFGSGYSSFAYLIELPLDKLKIDRAFVLRLKEGEVARRIVKAIIDLSQTLDLDCIIEGVESEDELEDLLIAGGRYVQGYLFGKPMGGKAVESYLAKELGLSEATDTTRITG